MAGKLIEVTPTVSSGSAYASGDQLGGLQTLTGAGEAGSDITKLLQISVVDKSSQDAPLDILFFDEEPTIASSDNSAADVSDAELVDKAIGAASITASDYVSLSSGSFASVSIDVQLKPKADGKLYALVVTTGTPTYTSTSDLVFKYLFEY